MKNEESEATYYALKGPSVANIKNKESIDKTKQELANLYAHIQLREAGIKTDYKRKEYLEKVLENKKARLPKYWKYLKF